MADETKAADSAAPNQAKVYILYTGGTIGMAPEDDKPGSPLKPKPLFGVDGQKGLMDYLPATYKNLDIKYEYGEIPPQDSSNLKLEHWVQMAQKIEAVYKDYDGFIILHGTDTMAYTASALSFMFENLGKPVVITGSQLPISAFRTDGVMNLANAINVAGYKASALPCIPEVVIVFADKILRGCRARKVSSSSWAGFDSPNFPPLGTIGEHIRINTKLIRPMPAAGQTLQAITDFSESVMDISLFPGIKSSLLGKILAMEAIQGVVLRTFGAGNAPDYEAFFKVLEAAQAAGKTIINTTQCVEGMVEMGLYAASSGLLERGVISALDMTPEAALTKLMWTLGTKLGDQIVPQMQVSQRGEQTENLFDLRYGACGNPQESQHVFRQYRTPDRRFDVSRLSKASVRLMGLGVQGANAGGTVEIRVFMNLPTANAKTLATHPRCIARFPVVWKGVPLNLSEQIEDVKARSAAGDGDITLSVVTDEGVKFWFDGLYMALFAQA